MTTVKTDPLARRRPPSPSATLEIDAMRVFLAIAERGGVTAAAERVARTPAAVSMQLKKLEETVGRPLFERSPRGMSLTPAGMRLAEQARRMMSLHAEALDMFREPDLVGDVRLGLVDDFGNVRLAEVLAGFAERHPDVTVTVALGATEVLYRKLDASALDVALLTPGVATPWRPGDVVAHEEPLVWAGRAGGRAVRRDPKPLAVAEVNCAWRVAALNALDRAGVAYRVAYTSDVYAGQHAAVAADLAIAPLPLSVAQAGFELLGEEHGLPASIGMCRMALRFGDTEAARSPATETLARQILDAFASPISDEPLLVRAG